MECIDKSFRIIIDQNLWRTSCSLPVKVVVLRALRWNTSIQLSWWFRRLGVDHDQDLHFYACTYLKPVIDAWKNKKIEIVSTKVSDSELSRLLLLNRHDLIGSPLLLDPTTDIYKDLLEQSLLPSGTKPDDFYTEKNKKQKMLRQIYVEHYEDSFWQKFILDAKIQKAHLVDAFIYWQASTFNVSYVLTADLKFIKNAGVWKRFLHKSPKVVRPKQCVHDLNLGPPDSSWITEIRNMAIQQEFLAAGYIPKAEGRLWLLKKLLKRNLGYVGPENSKHRANEKQVLMAVINMLFGKFGTRITGNSDGFFGPDDFDVQ